MCLIHSIVLVGDVPRAEYGGNVGSLTCHGLELLDALLLCIWFVGYSREEAGG